LSMTSVRPLGVIRWLGVALHIGELWKPHPLLKTTMQRQSNQSSTQTRLPRRSIIKQNNNNRNIPKNKNSQIRRALRPNGPPRRLQSQLGPRSKGAFDPPLRRFQGPIQNTGNNKSRIVFKEPLKTSAPQGVLLGSVGFGITTFQINPGLPATFPWLASQASAYESYKVNALMVEYRHTTNEFTGKGSIVIAPDYDADDDPPASMIEAEQMADSVQGACTRDWVCVLKPRGIGILGPKRYTRSTSIGNNQDIKTYDIAQVHVCTSGQADASEIGQLWIHYDITLSEPQPTNQFNDSFVGLLSNADGSGASITALMGTDAGATGRIIISVSNNTVTISGLQVGQFYIFHYHVNAATVTTQATITPVSGCTFLTTFYVDIKATNSLVEQKFVATSSVAVVTLGGVTVLATPSETLFFVMVVGSLNQ
jgi:hypothetical protein